MKKLIILAACFYTAFTQAQEVDSAIQKMKWTNIVQIGQTFDNNEELTGRLTGSIISGVQRNKLFAGIALGLNDYGDFNIGSAALYGKFRLKEEGVSPYGYASFGYGYPTHFKDGTRIGASANTDGGILYGSGIGVDVPLGKIKFLMQLGYKFQMTSYDEPAYYYDIWSSLAPYGGDGKHTTRKMHRIEFKIGIQF